jgi:hypothetical protein
VALIWSGARGRRESAATVHADAGHHACRSEQERQRQAGVANRNSRRTREPPPALWGLYHMTHLNHRLMLF